MKGVKLSPSAPLKLSHRRLILFCSLLAILQRVSSASVTVDKQLISSIGRGVLVFAAVGPDDTRKDADTLATKLLKLRMWPDDAGANVMCFSSSFYI